MLITLTNVLTPQEIEHINQTISGVQFQDGQLTTGFSARGVKRNLQLPPDSPQAKELGQVVVKALQRQPLFMAAAIPARIHPPLFARYESGMTYGKHVDNAIMGSSVKMRSDVSMTVFLSSPESYEGGELAIDDIFGHRQIKLDAGDAVLYPSTSVHHVNPVTSGKREVAVLWIQSLVRQDERRRILFELERMSSIIRSRSASQEEMESLQFCYHNLLRMWAEN
jgi:PKHD-type hydroxylase